MSNTEQIFVPEYNSDEALLTQQAVLDRMSVIFQMQQQQLAMQELMTRLMTQFIPTKQQTNVQLRPQCVKPEHSMIKADSSDKWIIFKDAWSRYKQMTSLTDQTEIRNKLRSACSSSVNEMLFNYIGPDAFNNLTEQQLLKHKICRREVRSPKSLQTAVLQDEAK